MRTGISLPSNLAEQMDRILKGLRHQTEAECILLADVSGQLISVQGELKGIDPTLMAALAAADVVATAELTRLIGGTDPGGAMLREGRRVNVYLFEVARRFVLVVVFRTTTLAAVVGMAGRRAVDRLRPLVVEFEDQTSAPNPISNRGFGDTLAKELDKAFGGL
jgi:predicted regulator of Ras-like GTPase activity (Roadblock/LC7/MglB family)